MAGLCSQHQGRRFGRLRGGSGRGSHRSWGRRSNLQQAYRELLPADGPDAGPAGSVRLPPRRPLDRHPGSRQLVRPCTQIISYIEKSSDSMRLSALFPHVVVICALAPVSAAAQAPALFDGESSSWHGFDRYDFLMNEKDLSIKPHKAGANEKNAV